MNCICFVSFGNPRVQTEISDNCNLPLLCIQLYIYTAWGHFHTMGSERKYWVIWGLGVNSGGQASTSVFKSLRALLERRLQKQRKTTVSALWQTWAILLISTQDLFICSIALLTLSHFILRTVRSWLWLLILRIRKLRHKQLNELTQHVRGSPLHLPWPGTKVTICMS